MARYVDFSLSWYVSHEYLLRNSSEAANSEQINYFSTTVLQSSVFFDIWCTSSNCWKYIRQLSAWTTFQTFGRSNGCWITLTNAASRNPTGRGSGRLVSNWLTYLFGLLWKLWLMHSYYPLIKTGVMSITGRSRTLREPMHRLSTYLHKFLSKMITEEFVFMGAIRGLSKTWADHVGNKKFWLCMILFDSLFLPSWFLVDMADNPYLQHLPPHQRGAAPSAGSSSTAAAAAKEPLFGFMPRKVTATQVTKAMVRGETIE